MADTSQTNTKSNFLVIILYTVFAVFFILIFRNASINKLWFDKVDSYWDAYKQQSENNATLEERTRERLGGNYIISQTVKNYFEQNNIKNPVVLFEPNDYLTENRIINFRLCEPIIFYNYTGLKSLWMNSSNVADATHIVYLTPQNVRIVAINSKEELQTILDKYKNYKSTL